MTTIATLFDGDASALIGRDPRGLAEDYAHESTQDGLYDLVVAEHRAMEAMVQMRSIVLAPTMSRSIAIQLIPALATACVSLRAVDALLEVARDWVEEMGDVRRHARAVADLRAMGEDVEEARVTVPISFNSEAVFDVQDASTLIITLRVHRRPPVVVGMHIIDQEDGERRVTTTPELIA